MARAEALLRAMAGSRRNTPSADALARYGLILGVLGSLTLGLGVFEGSDTRAQAPPSQPQPLIASSIATVGPAQQARLRRWTQLRSDAAAHVSARRDVLRAQLAGARERERERLARKRRRRARQPVRRAPVVRAAPAAPRAVRPTPTRAPAPHSVPPAAEPAPTAAPERDPPPKPADPGTGFDLTG